MASIPIDSIPAIQPSQTVSPSASAKPSHAGDEGSFQNHLQPNSNQATATEEKINRPEERSPTKDDSNKNNISDTSKPASTTEETASKQSEQDDNAVDNQKETSGNDEEKSETTAEVIVETQIDELTDEGLIEIEVEEDPEDLSEVEINVAADETIDLTEHARTELIDVFLQLETVNIEDAFVEETLEGSGNASDNLATTANHSTLDEATTQTTTPNHVSVIGERLINQAPEESAPAEATVDIETTQKIALHQQASDDGQNQQPKEGRQSRTQVQPTSKSERKKEPRQTGKTPEIATKPATEDTKSLALESILDSTTSDAKTTSETKVDPASSPAPLTTSTEGVAPSPSRFSQHIITRGGEQNPRTAPITDADQARFINRVAKAFEAAQSRDGEIRLRLSPPELGSLRLEIKVQGGVMTARIEADTAAARSLLLDNMSVLRERLAEQGIRLEQFNVDLTDRQPGGLPENELENKDANDSNAQQANSEQNDETDSQASSSINISADHPDDGRLNVVV